MIHTLNLPIKPERILPIFVSFCKLFSFFFWGGGGGGGETFLILTTFLKSAIRVVSLPKLWFRQNVQRIKAKKFGFPYSIRGLLIEKKKGWGFKMRLKITTDVKSLQAEQKNPKKHSAQLWGCTVAQSVECVTPGEDVLGSNLGCGSQLSTGWVGVSTMWLANIELMVFPLCLLCGSANRYQTSVSGPVRDIA